MTEEREGEMTLENLLGGDAASEFLEELRLSAENILDPNTTAKVARKVMLEVTMLPNETRDVCSTSVRSWRKDAPIKPQTTVCFVGRHQGVAMISENNARQSELFDDAQGGAIPAPRILREGEGQ